MFLRCCLIHTTIIILRHILYLVYLGQCLCLSLFMLHLCHLFFIFSLIFIAITHISLRQSIQVRFVKNNNSAVFLNNSLIV